MALIRGAISVQIEARPGIDIRIDDDGFLNEADECDCSLPGAVLNADGGPVGDIDSDCDLDLYDYGRFDDCMDGPSAPAPPFCPALYDFDADGDVDMDDFGSFQRAFTWAY